MVSSTAAQTKAEVTLAIWNCQNGISKMPATSGTTARKGPKKRPMKMPGMPQRLHEALAARDHLRMTRQRPDAGDRIFELKTHPIRQPVAKRGAERSRAIHTGQKLMPLVESSAPIATSALQAGISREMKASNSPKASANTIGGAQAACRRTKSVTCSTNRVQFHGAKGEPPRNGCNL